MNSAQEYHFALKTYATDALRRFTQRVGPVYVDVDETKPIRVGKLCNPKVYLEATDASSNAEEAARCDTAFQRMIAIYDNPKEAIQRTQLDRTFDEHVGQGRLCAQTIAANMQSRYRGNDFYHSFAARRVQLLGEDSHGRSEVYAPTWVVRVEMNK
jgi:hypothetical protein